MFISLMRIMNLKDMKSVVKQIAVFITLLIFLEGCGNDELKMITAGTSGNYRLLILNKQGSVKQGTGRFYLEFYDSKENRLVDVGKVLVQATMPMPGMPMVNDAKVEVTDVPGRYSVKYDFSMSGSWTLNIKFNGKNSSIIPISVN